MKNIKNAMKTLKEILSSLENLSDIELFVIDLFCGAGGLSEGVEEARIKGKKCAKVVCCVNHDKNAILSHNANIRNDYLTRNKRSVWTVATQPFREAHFATYPEKLIVDCIKAGCPEDGVVLDPFMGSGTTALVARKLNRNFIGFELNPDYAGIAEKRMERELGIFR